MRRRRSPPTPRAAAADAARRALGSPSARAALRTRAPLRCRGNLLVRTLVDVVIDPELMVESNSMTTLMVVVPKSGYKDFLDTYEKMAQYVVPSSAKQIYEGESRIQIPSLPPCIPVG